MKKLAYTFILSLLSAISLFSQVGFGFGGGLSVSNMYFTNIDINSKYRHDVLLSTHLYHQAFDKMNIGINLSYAQKGFNLSYSNIDNYTQFKLNYLQLNPEIHITAFNLEFLEFGFGLFYNRLIGSYEKSEFEDWFSIAKFNIFKKNDIGISSSIIFLYSDFAFNFRYNQSIFDSGNTNYRDYDGNLIPNVKAYNRSFEFAFLYYLRFQ